MGGGGSIEVLLFPDLKPDGLFALVLADKNKIKGPNNIFLEVFGLVSNSPIHIHTRPDLCKIPARNFSCLGPVWFPSSTANQEKAWDDD